MLMGIVRAPLINVTSSFNVCIYAPLFTFFTYSHKFDLKIFVSTNLKNPLVLNRSHTLG